MKRYWLFAGNDFYADGGMCDFRESFDSTEDARQHLSNLEQIDWWQIFDSCQHVIIDFQEGCYSGEVEGLCKRQPNMATIWDDA